MKQWILIIGLGLSATSMSDAQQMKIVANVGDRMTEYTISSQGKGYLMQLYSNELGQTDVEIGHKNFEWIREHLHEMSKLKRGPAACQRDQVEVSVKDSSGALQYEVCLLAKDARAKAMRNFLNALSTGI